MSKRWISVLLVLVLALAACGDDSSPFVAPDGATGGNSSSGSLGGGGDDGPSSGGLSDPQDVAVSQEISSMLMSAMAEMEAEEGPLGDMELIGQTEADCIGIGMAREFGADRLNELGLPPDDMNDPEALDLLGDATPGEVTAAIDVLLGCVDVKPLIVEALGEAGISSGGAGCLADEILAPGFIGGLVGTVMSAAESAEDASSLLGDPTIIGPIMQMLNTCLTPEELGSLMGGLGDLGDLGILGG